MATSLDRDDTHSGAFGYDLQGRLISEEYGTLKTSPFDGIDDAASDTFLMAMTYGLDTLNRRVGNGSAPGIETETWIDTDLDGIVDTPEVLSISHELDQRGGLTGLNDGTTVATVAQDVSGAVTDLAGTTDSYDWLGRPVLVRDSSNRPIFAVSYDGFGRVATRSALWPSGGKSTIYRNEAYFYDGVRRIQEVFIDPIDATPPWPTGPFDQPLNSGSNTPRTEAEFVWSAASGQPFDTCYVPMLTAEMRRNGAGRNRTHVYCRIQSRHRGMTHKTWTRGVQRWLVPILPQLEA